MAASRPATRRPHVQLVIRRHDGIVIDRLTAATRRSGERVAVEVVLKARTDRPRTLRITLGGCTAGSVAFPRCPAVASRDVRATTSATTHRVDLAVPLSRLPRRALQLTVTRPGMPVAPTSPRFAGGRLLLRSTAWELHPGTPYGLLSAPATGQARLDDLDLDVAGQTAARVRAQPRWSMAFPGEGSVTSVVAPCRNPLGSCAVGRTTTVAVRSGAASRYFQQPFFPLSRIGEVGLAVTRDGVVLLLAALPSPG